MLAKTTLENSLASFIGAVGASRSGIVKLGPRASGDIAEPTAEQRSKLLADLALAGTGSRAIVWLWGALIVVIFVIAIGFAIYHREDMKFVAVAILGGSGVNAFLLAQVRSVHAKLVSTQILLALLPNLPPQEWVKASVVLMDELLKAPKA